MKTILLSVFLALLLIASGPWGGGGDLWGAVSTTGEYKELEDPDKPLLANPGFDEPGEEGAAPAAWKGPVMLEDETNPARGELVQRLGFDAQYGSYVGYIYYASTHPQGWVGIAFEQSDAALRELDTTQHLVLSYRIRHQYSAGVGHISDHAGLVEVELAHNGETFLLRYLHRRHGELPDNSARVVHFDCEDPGWQSWGDNQRILNEDIAQAFPGLQDYNLTAVRIGILMNKTDQESSSFYWQFDNVQLETRDNTSVTVSGT